MYQVPQQENHYDCGIYLLHFIELFIRESLNVDFVPNQESLFTPLWGTSEVSAKRRDIEDLILELSLASRRKSRERETGLSQLYQRRPVLQISDVLETHLDGNGKGSIALDCISQSKYSGCRFVCLQKINIS